MDQPNSTNRADEQAAQWAACLALGQLKPTERAAFDAWLEADRRHRGALLRAQAACHLLEEAVAQSPDRLPLLGDDSTFRPREHRRRAGMRVALAAGVACILLTGTALFALRMPTGASPHRVMELADGSVASLREGAGIETEIDSRSRRIVLLSGEARFDVARDPSRPFIVHAGDVSAQATGTVYSVARVAGRGAHVSVEQGSVLVWSADDRDAAVHLRAGEELTLKPGATRGNDGDADRTGDITLDSATIADAAARFNRINTVQVFITTPRIGEVRIVGLFNANEPEAFARAAAAVAGGRVVRRGDDIFVEDATQ